jgi:hypothetical protein
LAAADGRHSALTQDTVACLAHVLMARVDPFREIATREAIRSTAVVSYSEPRLDIYGKFVSDPGQLGHSQPPQTVERSVRSAGSPVDDPPHLLET